MPKIDGLRPYPHPGKFEGGLLVDPYVYALTLEGWGDGLGDVSEMGYFWTALGLGPEALKRIRKIALEEDKETLTREEKGLIQGSYGAIVEETEQGFVDVTYYDTKAELDRKWARIERDVEEFYAETEEKEEA